MGNETVVEVVNGNEVAEKKAVPKIAAGGDKVVTDDVESLLNEKRLKDFKTNPIGLFGIWFQQSFQHGVPEPFIMSLATSSCSGLPSVRPVALCNVDPKGFYFSTNKESNKVRDLKENPRAAAAFYWSKLNRVVRVEGDVIEVDDKGANFHQWPRMLQIAEHSKFVVGKPLSDRKELVDEIEALTAKFADLDVIPQPDVIQSYCIVPTRIEFMQVHLTLPGDRIEFKRSSAGGGWTCVRLAR